MNISSSRDDSPSPTDQSSGRHAGRHRWLTMLLIIIGIITPILLGLGSYGLWQQYTATHNPYPVIASEVVTYSTDTPDETPPGAVCDNYQVAAAHPRLIEIPQLGVKACIERVGIDQQDRIAVPTNIHVAGWYVNSPLPGQEGVSLIDGHVLGRYDDAIFADLDQLSAGDEITITMGDDRTIAFEVVDRHSYPVADVMNHLFTPLEGTDRQLTLITCGGTFDQRSQTYDQRVVVRAKLK